MSIGTLLKTQFLTTTCTVLNLIKSKWEFQDKTVNNEAQVYF
jgi:hypothetical protein